MENALKGYLLYFRQTQPNGSREKYILIQFSLLPDLPTLLFFFDTGFLTLTFRRFELLTCESLVKSFSHIGLTEEQTAKRLQWISRAVAAHAVRRCTVWIYATLGQRLRVQRMQNGRIKGFLSIVPVVNPSDNISSIPNQ